MTTKHTPGPWHTGGKDNSIIYADHGYAVANAITYHKLTGDTQANARLIAAAPDMLSALQAIDAALWGTADYGAIQTVNGVSYQPFAVVRAAIAKATGSAST